MLSRQLLSFKHGKSALSVISQLHATCGQCSQKFPRLLSHSERLWHGSGFRNIEICTPNSRILLAAQENLAQTEYLERSRRLYSTNVVSGQAKPDVEDESIIKRVLTKVGFKPSTKTRLKIASHFLYESIADKVNYAHFFQFFNLPNTFNSWFLVTELHVWMLLVRTMAEGPESGEDGRFLRNSIVEALWGDVNTRAKKLGANNPSQLRKQIIILSEQFQAALIMYDEGIMSDDRVLAASLWRRFFEMDCDDYEKIEYLVKYVRQQVAMLDSLSRDDLIQKRKIPWADIATVKI